VKKKKRKALTTKFQTGQLQQGKCHAPEAGTKKKSRGGKKKGQKKKRLKKKKDLTSKKRFDYSGK